MASNKKSKMSVRSQTFRQYFATNTGVQYTARNVRIDFGNEITLLKPGQQANVSECQVIMDFYSFKSAHKLFGRMIKEIEKNFGKIDMAEEKKFAEKIKKIQEKKFKEIEDLIKS